MSLVVHELLFILSQVFSGLVGIFIREPVCFGAGVCGKKNSVS